MDEVHVERRLAAILVADIAGYSRLMAEDEAATVATLKGHQAVVLPLVEAHGGRIQDTAGDGILAEFRSVQQAVECAIAMIEETARIRSKWEANGKPALRIGIGINTGDAVVGNIGAEKVFGYTVIGDAVNLASRLEGKNKDYGTEIIVSEFTKSRIDDGFEMVYLDEVKVKGKERAVRIYEVKGPAVYPGRSEGSPAALPES